MGAIRDLVADILGVSPDAATFIIGVPLFLLAIYLMKKWFYNQWKLTRYQIKNLINFNNE